MKIAIVVEGGIVQEVITDEEIMDVVVIDRDTDGLDESEIKKVDGWKTYVYNGLRRTKHEPERLEKIYQEATE